MTADSGAHPVGDDQTTTRPEHAGGPRVGVRDRQVADPPRRDRVR